MLEDDKSTDPGDVRDELKTESILMNVALKDLNKNWDFSAVVLLLVADQGPMFKLSLLPHCLRALGAQPRHRKPAFVTHDNEASLCVAPLSENVEAD